MKKTLILSCLSVFLFSSCASYLARSQGRDGSQAQANSKQNSLLSTLFSDEESDLRNNRPNATANLNLKSDTSRLPTNFQETSRYPKQDLMVALSPLHLSRIEGNTWRTAANPAVVYGIMARILSQTYIISSADRKNFNVQTDWDKFFIDGRLFRNRMSVTVFPVGSRQTEIVIKNSVEYYTGTMVKQEENTAWLPSPDLTDEVNKLVENTDRQTTYAYSQSMMRN